MKTYPNLEDFVIPGKELLVSDTIEEKVYQDIANYESELVQREAEAIRESNKIILED